MYGHMKQLASWYVMAISVALLMHHQMVAAHIGAPIHHAKSLGIAPSNKMVPSD